MTTGTFIRRLPRKTKESVKVVILYERQPRPRWGLFNELLVVPANGGRKRWVSSSNVERDQP